MQMKYSLPPLERESRDEEYNDSVGKVIKAEEFIREKTEGSGITQATALKHAVLQLRCRQCYLGAFSEGCHVRVPAETRCAVLVLFL